MAYGILILFFAISVFAEEKVNPNDPNLYGRDGAMNYDSQVPIRDVDATAGALLIDKKEVPIPAKKPKVEADPKNDDQTPDKEEAKPEDKKN